MQLPQTIIVDLGEGSETLASEFAIGADIRIAAQGTKVKFNHSHYGLVPAAGGMSMLSTLVTPAFARNWILTGSSIKEEVLIESGFVAQMYDSTNRQETIQEILSTLSKVAPVQRIQSKMGLFENLRSQFEVGIVMDRKVAKASMVSEDWRTKRPEQKELDFMPAKSLSYAVKLSLVKNEDTPRNLDH